MSQLTHDELVVTRRVVIDAFDEADLTHLLASVPTLTEALSGRGHLAPARIRDGGWRPERPPITRAALAHLLAEPAGTHASLTSLDLFHLRVVILANLHGGALTTDVATTELGADGPDLVRAAAEELRRRVLGRPGRSDDGPDVLLRLLPEVGDYVGLPGTPLTGSIDSFTSDHLALALKAHGRKLVDLPRKDDRADALLVLLTDRDHLDSLLEEMPPQARRILNRLVSGPVPLDDVVDWWYPGTGRTYSYQQDRNTPFDWLTERLLAWGDPYDDEMAWTWLEVQMTVRGRLFDDWQSTAPAIDPTAIDDPGPFLPPVLVTFESMLDHLADSPAKGLKAGGIGVRATKSIAKDLGAEPTTIAVLGHLAVTLGLVASLPIGPATGRGNKRSTPMGWAPTARREEWSARSPVERWALLVQAWLDDRDLDEADDGLPNKVDVDDLRAPWQDMAYMRTLRRDLLDVLAALPDDTGIAETELFAHAAWQHPTTCDPGRLGGPVAIARILGLVPPEGPIGLTAIARTLLQSPERVADQVTSVTGALIVQADLTVMAPPETPPEVMARLDRYGEVESGVGMRIVRLTRGAMATAISSGREDADAVLAFLDDHSRTDLPDTVRQLVRDVERGHGRLRAGAAGSYLRSDDEALVASAAGISAAKLTVLAPTVAVSTLERDKLVEVLRSKGLPLVAEEPGGAAVVTTKRTAGQRWGAKVDLTDIHAVLPDIPSVSELASTLFASAGQTITTDFRGQWQQRTTR